MSEQIEKAWKALENKFPLTSHRKSFDAGVEVGRKDRQQLIEFFMWFRNNGDDFIGVSVENIIDEYIAQSPIK